MNKQLRFKKTLLAAKNALDETGTRFFLASGTALGAWRDGKFIEYDGDIDLGVFATGLDPITIMAMCQYGFVLLQEFGTLQSGYQLRFAHVEHEVRLDIFGYYEEKEFMWYATHSHWICDCMTRGFCRWKFQKFDLRPVVFLDEAFLMPCPPEQYLVAKYGADWQTPREFTYPQGVSGLYKNRINEFSLLKTTQVLLGAIRNRVKKLM